MLTQRTNSLSKQRFPSLFSAFFCESSWNAWPGDSNSYRLRFRYEEEWGANWTFNELHWNRFRLPLGPPDQVLLFQLLSLSSSPCSAQSTCVFFTLLLTLFCFPLPLGNRRDKHLEWPRLPRTGENSWKKRVFRIGIIKVLRFLDFWVCEIWRRRRENTRQQAIAGDRD